VVALAADPASQVSSVRLEDRLTDSGVVAIAVSRRRGARLVVEELCISCRALGRQLEDLIVAQLITSGPLFAGSTEVTFRFLDGPRNEPARRWLEEFTSEPIPPAPHAVSISTAPDRLLAASTNSEVRVEVLR
jgi:predicted enzyme involved in methoxymalonyl-ACP biosynthesis